MDCSHPASEQWGPFDGLVRYWMTNRPPGALTLFDINICSIIFENKIWISSFVDARNNNRNTYFLNLWVAVLKECFFR